jgi:hypothetical protein
MFKFKVNLMTGPTRLRANHQVRDSDFTYQDITDWFQAEPPMMPDVISMGSRVAIRGDLLGYTPGPGETDYYLSTVGSVYPR